MMSQLSQTQAPSNSAAAQVAAPRLRNAGATRQALLNSARRHFARESYENVGLREIARDAGVDPSLVCRYFGGKEQLFQAAVRDEEFALIEAGSLDTLATYFADLVLSNFDTEEKTERLMMLLNSIASPRASQIIRDAIEADIVTPVSAMLEGPDARTRAQLCLSVLMGASMMSAMHKDRDSRNLTEQHRQQLSKLFRAALDV